LFTYSKRKNVNSIIRTAVAFGIDQFFLINKTEEQIKKSKVLNQFNLNYGIKGCKEFLPKYQSFPSIKEAKEFFVKNNMHVCGIEIEENAES